MNLGRDPLVPLWWPGYPLVARPASPTGPGRAAGPATWATVEQVGAFLRIPPATIADDVELAAATDAANAFAWRRRQTAGYAEDDPTTSPGADVTRAVVLYAGVLYREGGGADGQPSFAEYPPGSIPFGTMGQIYRLLGTNRPVVA